MYTKICIALLIFSCLLKVPVSAQRSPLTISVGVNYGTYAMEDMRHFQEYLLLVPHLNFGLTEYKSSTTFPAQLGYEASILTSVKRFQLGLTAWRNSTGARNDYQDYTGFLRMDIITTVNGVGVKSNYTFTDDDEHQFYATLHGGIGFNRVKLKQHFRLFGINDESETLEYESQNVIITPGVGYRLLFANRIFLAAEAKYEFNVSNSKVRAREGTYVLINGLNGNEQEVAWDGFRLSLNVGYEF